MKILIEAHHPAQIHFWKNPIRKLQEDGHEVLMIGRDRDVMRHLLEVYDWISADIPKRTTKKNKFPILEMLKRQYSVMRAIKEFNPDVVASLMGSYAQGAKLLGVRNVIFTDSEFQRFNHRIAHPFADEIHTPTCLDIDFAKKHRRYDGFHELSYINDRYFDFSDTTVPVSMGLEPKNYVFMRLSAWNTLHDIGNEGLSDGQLISLVNALSKRFRVVIQGEEGRMPEGLEKCLLRFKPDQYHQILCHSCFVITEGFTTASEALAMGVPTIVINKLSSDTMRYQHQNYGILHHYQTSAEGAEIARSFIDSMPDPEESRKVGRAYRQGHIDVVKYVVRSITGESPRLY